MDLLFLSNFSLNRISKVYPKLEFRTTLIFISIALLFFTACETVQHDVVNAESADFQVVSVSVPDSFTYSSSASGFKITVELTSSELIQGVKYKLFSSDKQNVFADGVSMYDDGLPSHSDAALGDNIFSAMIDMSPSNPSGRYLIEITAQYLVFGEVEEMNIAQAYFDYNSGVANQPPVISNLSIVDSVNVGAAFLFSVKADDPNGAADVNSVFYELYRPDGSQVQNSQGITKFPLFDNGDTSGNGDQTANDGTYTNKLTFPDSNPPQQKGDWKFVFRAEDKSGVESNIIEKTVKLL